MHPYKMDLIQNLNKDSKRIHYKSNLFYMRINKLELDMYQSLPW